LLQLLLQLLLHVARLQQKPLRQALVSWFPFQRHILNTQQIRTVDIGGGPEKRGKHYFDIDPCDIAITDN